MLKSLSVAAALALAPLAVFAAEAGGHVEDHAFSFEGPFGKFDQLQLQRGLQVYTEVCASCHGMHYVPIRTLADEGGPHLPEDQVRAYAAQFTVYDEAANQHLLDLNTGEFRPLETSDNFPANHSQNAPDLSLIAKNRAGFHGPYGTGINQLFRGIGGPEYVFSILTGYTGADKEEAGSVFYENTAFSTGWIAMPPPLADDLITYADGTPATTAQMAEDVAAFLTWAAEPHLMARKQFGFVATIFFVLFAVLLYLTNKRIWAPVKGKHHA